MMTHKKCFLMCFLVIFLSMIYSLPVSAMNTGLETEELSSEELEQEKQTSNITLLDKIPEEMKIESFDVNEKGMVALKFFNGITSNCYIGVYDASGKFQYGYLYTSYGSTAVEWDGDNLNIYFVREDLVYSVNANGEIEDVLGVKNTSGNSEYCSNHMQAKKKTMGDLEYRITNIPRISNLVAESYSQLVVKNADGEETVLYDAFENGHDMTLREGLVYAGLVIVGLIIALIGATIKFRERNGEGTYLAAEGIEKKELW